ncbi:uncharacterized protein LOC121599215 [Anopheles merus]|uniref:uncharacterized protein LOC121599215 n=1 Tax=Anopheles merus TaxID=30066 RepID=UPI001BE41ABE|nr:uncharacterized protein LOC121599215 [Anopheles merus]
MLFDALSGRPNRLLLLPKGGGHGGEVNLSSTRVVQKSSRSPPESEENIARGGAHENVKCKSTSSPRFAALGTTKANHSETTPGDNERWQKGERRGTEDVSITPKQQLSVQTKT